MGLKLDRRIWRVKSLGGPAVWVVWAVWAIVSTSCGPSPRPAPVVGNSWPTVLGNERRSAFENESFSDSLDVIWDINAGSGTRAPLLYSDSAVFIGTANRQLLAFSTRNGRRLWDRRFEGEIPDQLVRAGRTLFAISSEETGHLYARDVERGRGLWKQTLGIARFAPLLDGGIVYVGNDRGVIFALRSEDGSQIWRAHVSSLGSTFLNYGDAIIAASNGDSIFAISKQSGAVLRRARLESAVAAPPALYGDTIVLATHSGSAYALDAKTFRTLWRVDTGAPIMAAPVVTGDGVIHLLNRNTDIWRVRNGAGVKVATLDGAATASFTVARDRYVIGAVDGTLYVTDRSGHVVAKHHFNEGIYAPVMIGGGALYATLGRGRIVKLR